MNKDNNEQDLELLIQKEMAKYPISPSHNLSHINLVLDFSMQLQYIYGGNKKLLTAAVMLHDLGRANPDLHGLDSIDESVKMAKDILRSINFKTEMINDVIDVINQHDQPNIRPNSLEARILKDADFLAGFGAWGVIRIAMWAGETGGGLDQVQDRLKNRLLERMESLEFPESKQMAKRELLFTNLFTSYWNRSPKYPLKKHPGKYIILEGISGSGKDTQIKLVEEYLIHKGRNVKLVVEPSGLYHGLKEFWEEKYNENFDSRNLKKFNLLADRHKLIEETVIPELEKGNIVISNRSYISFLVYQCFDKTLNGYNELELAEMAYIHQFVPVPDLIILYDLSAEKAMDRITNREKKRSSLENISMLSIFRKKYLSIINGGQHGLKSVVINSDMPLEKVASETQKTIEDSLL